MKIRYLLNSVNDVRYSVQNVRAAQCEDGTYVGCDEISGAAYLMDLLPIEMPAGVQAEPLTKIALNVYADGCVLVADLSDPDFLCDVEVRDDTLVCDWHDNPLSLADISQKLGDERTMHALAEALRKLARSTTSNLGRTIKDAAVMHKDRDDAFLVAVVTQLAEADNV